MTDVFRLTKVITGVTFSPEGRGSLSTLPVDAQLRLTGQSSLAGFVDVTDGDRVYCIFRVDLIARSVPLRTIAATAKTGTRTAVRQLVPSARAHRTDSYVPLAVAG